MFKNSSACFVLWILLQLSVGINCLISDHTATLIDDKLYILYYDKFFYFEVSVPLNTKNLLRKNLTTIVPRHYGASSVKGGANNNTLFLYGGSNVTEMELVYTFDTKSNSWSVPKITGVNTIRKSHLTGIIDNNGKMYLWGGALGLENLDIRRQGINDFLILDTINLSWGKGSINGAPFIPSVGYGAVLLPNNKIIYLGLAKISDISLRLNEVYLYDTIYDNWSAVTTKGNTPSNREMFSAVLGLDGQRVIIFGGFNAGSGSDVLHVLNLSNFEWSIPKVSGKIPANRSGHKANVIGQYMVVSFGDLLDSSDKNDILLLDISNNDEYVWFFPSTIYSPISSTTSPISSTSSPTSSTSNDKSNKSRIIGAIVGSFGVIFLAVMCFLLYKWKKNKQVQGNAIKEEGINSVILTKRNHDQGQEEIPPTSLPINKQENENRTNHDPIDDIVYNHGQEILPVPAGNENKSNNEPIDNNVYNHGQEAIPIVNEKLSLQHIDDDVLQHLVQTLSQEIISRKEKLQNNERASSSNITNNDNK